MKLLTHLPTAMELKNAYWNESLSTIAIAKRYGVGATTVGRWFAKYGIPKRAKGCPNLNRPSDAELAQLYIEGKLSSADLAIRFNCTACTICKWLKEAGVKTRSFSEAASLKMARRTYEEKLRNSEASRNSIAFKTHTHDRRCKIAETRQGTRIMSEYETALYFALEANSIKTQPQYAVDKYNIDLAIPERMLAIEVDGGNWHMQHKRKKRQDAAKTAYLEANGWTILRFSNWRNPNWINDALPIIMSALR